MGLGPAAAEFSLGLDRRDARPHTCTYFLGFDDFAATQTRSADPYMLGRGSHLGVNRAQIDVPAPLAHIVGVTDGISKLRPLAADIANSCHNSEFLPGCCRNLDFTGIW
jgi:hypothetical protein